MGKLSVSKQEMTSVSAMRWQHHFLIHLENKDTDTAWHWPCDWWTSTANRPRRRIHLASRELTHLSPSPMASTRRTGYWPGKAATKGRDNLRHVYGWPIIRTAVGREGMEDDPLHPYSAAQIILQEVMWMPPPGCMSFMQCFTYKCTSDYF